MCYKYDRPGHTVRDCTWFGANAVMAEGTELETAISPSAGDVDAHHIHQGGVLEVLPLLEIIVLNIMLYLWMMLLVIIAN